MRVDLHMHTEYSEDAAHPQSPLDKAQACAQAGLHIIGLTDHLDFYRSRPPAYNRDVAGCLRAAREAKARMAQQLEVLVGIELGQPHSDPICARAFLDEYGAQLDMVIGSVHAPIDDVDAYFVKFAEVDCDAYLKTYFAQLEALIDFGGFDVLAHIDYPLRVMKHGDYMPSFDHYMDRVERVLRACIARGRALELNAAGLAGWQKAVGPPQNVLYEYRRLGGERISIGSDAHTLQAVGRGLDESIQKARDAGFTQVTVFRARVPYQVELG